MPVLPVLLVNSLLLAQLPHLPAHLVVIPPTARLVLMLQQDHAPIVMTATVWPQGLALNAQMIIVLIVMLLVPANVIHVLRVTNSMLSLRHVPHVLLLNLHLLEPIHAHLVPLPVSLVKALQLHAKAV